jgi:hypothetical protein
MIKNIIFLIFITTFLNANPSLDSRELCDNIFTTRDYEEVPYNSTVQEIVQFTKGALSTSISMSTSRIYLAGSNGINKVILNACYDTNKELSKSKLNYYLLLYSNIINTALFVKLNELE